MLAHWFSRVGSIVAPDDKINDEAQHQEDADFWQFLAPDPNFEPRPAPPSGAFSTLMDQHEGDICVECEHCHKSTPLPPSLINSLKNTWRSIPVQTNTQGTPIQASRESLMTPDTNRSFSRSVLETPSASDKKSVVEDLVLSAARDTATRYCPSS